MSLLSELLQDKKHIHFIGIGGSGMYPLVQILHSKGYFITGSDNNESDTLDAVKALGIPVFLGHSARNIDRADLIVHTAAIMADNEELIAAKASSVPVIERSVLLGAVSSDYSHCIGIAGTHGKTSTASMLTQILLECGLDPTAVIGGKLPAIGGNGRAGKSEIMVCEACEFVDTFLKLSPAISVILNIDEDHMDYFKTLDNLILSFRKFASLATKCIIANGEDPNTLRATQGLPQRVITFGYDAGNDYSADNITLLPYGSNFTLLHKGEALFEVHLSVPGRHNVLNALAAIAAALETGADKKGIGKALYEFRGAGRRFEILYQENGITVADDYAHHPAELKVTLDAAKSMGFQRVVAIFQPFTFSRTALLLSDFARVLSAADLTVLTEIMGSREKNTYHIYSSDLQALIPDSVCLPTFDEVADYCAGIAKEGDLFLTMGCGDVYKVAKKLIKRLSNKGQS